jgi:hypothetical protein
MMSSHELARVRRQMQRRLRVLLAQRRVTAAHYPAEQRFAPPNGAPQPSAEPTPES